MLKWIKEYIGFIVLGFIFIILNTVVIWGVHKDTGTWWGFASPIGLILVWMLAKGQSDIRMG